jgi:hypothetical protein
MMSIEGYDRNKKPQRFVSLRLQTSLRQKRKLAVSMAPKIDEVNKKFYWMKRKNGLFPAGEGRRIPVPGFMPRLYFVFFLC